MLESTFLFSTFTEDKSSCRLSLQVKKNLKGNHYLLGKNILLTPMSFTSLLRPFFVQAVFSESIFYYQDNPFTKNESRGHWLISG